MFEQTKLNGRMGTLGLSAWEGSRRAGWQAAHLLVASGKKFEQTKLNGRQGGNGAFSMGRTGKSCTASTSLT
eukprot:1137427-Pelagomonas_calceolata.AAC.3